MTVGIVAVLCAIAIPSIITVNRSMNDRDLDNSARAVYLAAQSNLAQMRSSGDLEKLAVMKSDQGARNVPESGNANMGDDWNEQLRHTVSGTSEAFNLVLPANVLDAQLREQQILIEYNPFSGHVYAVFYSEGEQELSYSSIADRKDEAALKEKGIGYYCGGSVTIAPAEVNSTAVTLSADTDGQELIASVTVPVPESYTNHQDKFHEHLSAKLTIRGEMSGAELVIPTDSLSLKKELCIGSPNYIEFTFVLDSLNASNAFAALNTELGKVNAPTMFTLGENLTITADVQFDAPEGETILTFDEVVITGVNSLFAEMKENKDASGNVVSYEVELSNGRHLQNLNALNSELAKKVATIKLVEDIYWNETVEYYTDAYVTPKAARAAEAVDYEHFVPLNTSVFTHTSVFFDGGDHRILYLNIDTTGDAGLFSVCNLAQVKDLAIVSPVIKGTQNVGALAGAANSVTFTNCSVYIDTEDEYFSWDKMEEYGVFSTEKDAGGLVGYVSGTNAAFTECFAAVSVTLENKTDQVDYAGGFVGKATNVKFTRCYASGDVEGERVGGFVGLNDGSTFARCFASGDVYAALLAGVAGGFVGEMQNYSAVTPSYSECYAVGVVEGKKDSETVKATVDGFCGAGLTLPTDAENDTDYFATVVKVYQNSYFLAHMPGETSLCATVANYGQLSSVNNDSANVLTSDYWNPATKDTTHRYSVNGEGVYPFVMLKGMDFYGDWEAEQAPFAIAYFETYDDENDDDKDDTGYYISDEKTSTLRNEGVIVESDGYILLTDAVASSVTVNEKQVHPRKTSDGKYEMFNEASYIYDLPIEKSENSFYNEVIVTQTTTDGEGEPNTTTYTLYYNPDFALTQLNPVFNEKGEIEEAAQVNGIPSKIYIRTARHLDAIAKNTTYQGSIYNYVQMIDVDFTTYGGTDGYKMEKPIANFAGTYTGSGGYVNQAEIKLKDAVTLFTKITGKVSDVDVVAGDLGSAVSGFVMENAGEIINCTVGPAGDKIDSGYAAGTLKYGFAAENSGTIRGSMANTAATNAAFVGTNTDTGIIADCYAWYPGTTADTETKIVFAETDNGEIVSSYAAIYEKLDADNNVIEPAYVLVYDRDGVAAFRDTLTGVTLGENWYSYSDTIINEKGYYPYSTPEGITHRGGWSVFAEYDAFTGYYYYETDVNGEITGLYIESVGTTGEVVLNTFGENAPAGTAYGIYTVNPIVRESAYEVAEVALTLNSAPIVPSNLESGDNKDALVLKIEEAFKTKYGAEYDCTMVRELSSRSIYVLNGAEINTWFAPANADGAYRIRTAEQFAAIEEFPGESFIQETDITITAPITYFDGTYDGGENILRYDSEKPLTITLNAANGEEVEIDDGNGGKTTVIRDNVAYGLFANITDEDAVIKNCRVVDVKIDIKEESVEGKTVEITAAIGGLVGENHGTIKTSSVEGLTVTHTAATVTEGTSYTADIALGGLVGRMADGRLDECFVAGDITMAADASDSIGGAVGVVVAEEETSVTCIDSYAAVNISASDATVGAFVGKAEDGTFYYCHGWNGVNEFIGVDKADTLRLVKCYFTVLDSESNYLVAYRQEVDNTGIDRVQVTYPLTDIVRYLNDDRGDIWDTKTTEVDEDGKTVGEPRNVKYPVLAGRYDANAIGTPNLYKEPEIESAKLDAPGATEAPIETEEPEAEPETGEQPDVTAEPEATEQPDVTAAPEITPEPTVEPTETPVVEVTPEPTAETEPVTEEA